MPALNGQRYFISTAVFLNEILKLTISLTMALFDLASNPKNADTSTATALFSELARAVFNDSWKLAIPAVLYTLQNGLQYVAVSNLDASTFQITNQFKVFTTAIFSMLFLGRTIDARKWTALGVLVFGIVIVTLSAGSAESPVLSVKDLKAGAAFHEARNIWDLKNTGNKAARNLNKRSATYEGIEDDFLDSNPHMNSTIGLLAAVISCMISGFAGSVFEKIVREPRGERGTSIWIRNVQLSFYSIWPALIVGVLFLDSEEIAADGFFTGYSWPVWLAIVLQAVGGIAVGLLTKMDSGLSKSISGGISVALTFCLGLIFFDLSVNSYVSCAAQYTETRSRLTKLSTSSAPQSRFPHSMSSTPPQKSSSPNSGRLKSESHPERRKRSRATSIWKPALHPRNLPSARISSRSRPAGLAHPPTSDDITGIRVLKV